MRREALQNARLESVLLGSAVAALLVTVVVAAAVPGFVADPDSQDERPARLVVSETTLAAGEVTGETASLQVTAFVRHHGGTAENATLLVRATDAESGLVADRTERDLGDVDGEREREATAAVTVPREGSYEVAAILYVDGNRVDAARTTVSGVEALTPPYARTNVEFTRFPRQPSVEYRVASVDDDSATLDVTSYLTSGGDDPESGLELVVTARQAESNVVADRTEVTVGSIDPGRTASPSVELTVPDGYNYYLDAALWRDGVLLESTRAVANLDPRETVSADETREPVRFEAEDFEHQRGGGDPARDGPEEGAEGQSGFGAAVAAVALLGSVLAARRWSR